MNVAGVLRWRLRLLRNTLFRRARRGSARHPLLGAVLAAGLGALLFGGMRALFAWVDPNGSSPDEAGVLLGLALTAGLFGLLVFDLQEAIGVLLLDSDLELLRRAPLRARERFGLKLVDAMARTSSMVVVLLLPALLAYVASYGAGGWGPVLVPLLLAGLWSIPVGLGVALAITVVSRLPARHAREGLALFTTFGLVLVWLANVYALPRDFDPTRLFRGAGVGVAIVTPLGPLGLDYAYGFDRTNTLGQPAPAWQLHFRLGNIFQ